MKEFKGTPHIEAKKEDIASIVLMPGDPLRAKYIVEKYFDNYDLVNKVRNVFAYTGHYKGKKLTVMASGMGIPSVSIYAYELFKFYDVKTIIRIGSCGSYSPNYKIGSTILAKEVYSDSKIALSMFNDDTNFEIVNKDLNSKFLKSADKLKIDLKECRVHTMDAFDPYAPYQKKENVEISEMEAFALVKIAKNTNNQATCLLTVVDDIVNKNGLTSKERQKCLDEMILIALEGTLLL